MSRSGIAISVGAVCMAAFCGGPLRGQAVPTGERLRVYLDCGSCDFNFVRTEITWVDWVRDRQDSDVHILVTTQATGAGGREYVLEFIGRGRFQSKLDTLVHRSTRDDTPDLVRQGLTQVLKMGMMPYLVGTPAERLLLIGLRPPAGPGGEGRPAGTPPGPPQAGQARDPWDFWVFTISGNGYVSGESRQQFASYNLSLSASRTTDAWKISNRVSGSTSESSFDLDEETTITSTRRTYGASTLVVRSIGSNFSAGFSGSLESSTFGNIELGFRLAPAIEYDIYPYAESTRRLFVLRYSLGVNSFDYREITVFDEVKETRASHALEAGYTVRQPWGSLNFGIDLSQFLHDTDKWRGSASGSASLRLVRGLNLNVGGYYGRVRDQLSLAKEGATRDEILLRLKQLRTNYIYGINFGLSYRFGSSINNVVNPRMSGFGGISGGETVIIF